MTIVNSFTVPVKYDIIVDANKHLKEVNEQLAKAPGIFATIGAGKGLQFDVLYTACRNTETGDFRVEGKPTLDNARLDIISVEVKNVSLTDPVYSGVQTTHSRDIPLYSILVCIKNVVEWSTARGIIENGKWTTQVTKFYEEDGEAATGISKTKKRLIMDGLGDALVVLVNIVALYGENPPNIINAMLQRARDRIETEVPVGDAHRLFHKMRLYFTLMNDTLYQASDWRIRNNVTVEDQKTLPGVFETDIEEYMRLALWHMEALARAYEVTLEQCFSLAWDEIKDRTGFLNADGIFVKDADR